MGDEVTRNEFEGIGACVFDAYGTLFDFNAAAARCRDALGDQADPLSPYGAPSNSNILGCAASWGGMSISGK